MGIGKNIKLLRISKGMTQKELGKRAGVSDSMIAYVESGQKALSEETGKKIALALDCTFTDLTTKEFQISIK